MAKKYIQTKISKILDNLESAVIEAVQLHTATLPTRKHEEMVRIGRNYIRKAKEKFKDLQRDLPVDI